MKFLDRRSEENQFFRSFVEFDRSDEASQFFRDFLELNDEFIARFRLNDRYVAQYLIRFDC
jgi:hypothetical protein